MKFDLTIISKCKNNKQRKLSNIRTRNSLNKSYGLMKRNGEIQDYKVFNVKIRKRIQSALIQIIPNMCAKEIIVGFTKPKEI